MALTWVNASHVFSVFLARAEGYILMEFFFFFSVLLIIIIIGLYFLFLFFWLNIYKFGKTPGFMGVGLC